MVDYTTPILQACNIAYALINAVLIVISNRDGNETNATENS